MRHALLHITIAIAAIALMLMPLVAYSQCDVEECNSLQRRLDSALATITPSSHDSTKARIYHYISKYTEYADSAIKYATLSLKHCGKDDQQLVSTNLGNIAWGYIKNNIYDSAYIYLKKSIDISTQIGDSTKLPGTYLLMSWMFERKSINDSALHYAHNALDICIRTKDTVMLTHCYQTLGNLSYEKRFTQSAEEYYRLALHLNTKVGNLTGMASNMQWIGDTYLLYYDKEHDPSCLDTAMEYFTRALAIIDSAKLDNEIITKCKYDTYSDIAAAYIDMAKATGEQRYADSCLAYFKIAEKYFLQHGEQSAYIDFNRSYVEYLIFKGRYRDAEKHLIDLEKYFSENTAATILQAHHRQLKDVYVKLGDWEKAFLHGEEEHKYFTRYLNDSTMNATADSKTEQALMIEHLNQENAERIHAEQQSRMTAINIALLIGLALTIALAISIHHALKTKKRSNTELLIKNEMLNSQKSEIEAQRDEIEEQNDLLTQQWQDVETVNKRIIYSINYAQQIQNAVIPSKKHLDAIFSENFVYYRPKNIVSGDFYSAAQCGRYSVMITADCTGHGIPGAFLSMLGISALKEYMASEDDAEHPGLVLDKMRDFIKATLNTDNNAITSDGMDMTICCIDRQQMVMKYAIANQTAFIIHNGEATRLKGDSMPVGRFLVKDRSFKTRSHPIAKGDMLYMFSDGIQDQIGGDGNAHNEMQRFTSQRLLDILEKTHHLPAQKQLEIFTKAINDWQGALPQIDDMTLVGIRI